MIESAYKALEPRLAATRALYKSLETKLSRKLKLEPYSDLMWSIRLYLVKDIHITLTPTTDIDYILVTTSSTSHIIHGISKVVSFASTLRKQYKSKLRELKGKRPKRRHRKHKSKFVVTRIVDEVDF